MANIFVPSYNPSLALMTPGWPFVQTSGDSNLGNVATAEVDAHEKPTSASAVNLLNAQKNSPAGSGGRV